MIKNALQFHEHHWQNYIQQHPQEPKGYIQRGMVRFKQARLDDAIADFNQAETLN
ncbi:MAG: hypothetical protein F6K03_08355, partial [Kamptonema sp. SIO4C4]|nr:hypothetical protein [Kamptonema sp. SIO4C4]